MSNSTPAVSVLLPFHRARTTLVQCMDSIVTQTFARLEVVAVDDGSPDGCTELLNEYVARDPRVRLLRPGRVGLVAALNLGLEAARAPLVARMDADDRMEPDRLALQEGYLQRHPEVDVVGSRVRLFPEQAVGPGLWEYVRWQDLCLSPVDMAAEIYREAPLVHPTAMFRRDVILGLGGYWEGCFPEDYELWLRVSRAGRAMAKLDRTLLHWRQREDSHSRTDPRYSRAAFDRLRTKYLACDFRLRGGRDLVFWGAGRRTRRRSDLLAQLGHRPAAYVDIDPGKIGRRIDGVPVIPPERLPRSNRPLVLSYVASHGAPELIGRRLQVMGYERGRDFLTVG